MLAEFVKSGRGDACSVRRYRVTVRTFRDFAPGLRRIAEPGCASARLNYRPTCCSKVRRMSMVPGVLRMKVMFGESGEILMFRARLIFLAAAFAIVASPVAAQQTFADPTSSPPQQTSSDQATSPSQQSAPETSPPGPEQQSAPAPVPPPFPPMPRARPSHRWVDVGGHRARPAHHQMKRSHRREAAAGRRTPRMSRRELRKCHRMTAKQLRRSHACRALVLHGNEGRKAHSHHHRQDHHHHRNAKQSQSSRRLHHSRLRRHSARRHSS